MAQAASAPGSAGSQASKCSSAAVAPTRSVRSGDDDFATATVVEGVEQLLQAAPAGAISALRHCKDASALRKEILELLRRPPSALPCPAEELVCLGESAIETEELEEVVRSHWPDHKEGKATYRKLMLCGIESPQALLRSLTSRAPGRCYLNDMLADAGFRVLRPQSVEALHADLEVRVRQRMEVAEEGSRPILVTAPHNVFLLRDGQEPHVMEEYTTLIAQRLARQLSGTCLSWSRAEQYRTELLWFLARHQGHSEKDGDPGVLLDPRNRDPNYLSAEELTNNQWFQQVSSLADAWRDSLGHERPLLHVDVHGCRDPPFTPSHLTVGLAAMKREVDSGKGPVPLARFETFAAALEAELSSALRCLELRPKALLVRVLVPESEDENGIERLSGAWPTSSRRFTQSQQAISFAKFTHSCQLEMSKALRRALVKNDRTGINLGKVLHKAWTSALNLSLPALSDSQPVAQRTVTRSRTSSCIKHPQQCARRRCSSERVRVVAA